HDTIESAFLGVGTSPRAVVLIGDSQARDLPEGVVVIDARPGQPDADLTHLEQTILELGSHRGARIVIRDLDNLVRRLGPERALGFFTRTCPRLFDMGALAYWRASQRGSGQI